MPRQNSSMVRHFTFLYLATIYILVFFAARVQKWTGSIERIISGLENTDMKMVLKMLRDPQVSCPPDMIDFLAQLLENAGMLFKVLVSCLCSLRTQIL